MSSLSYKLLELATRVHGHLGLRYIPQDIDAQAAAILNSSARAVKHILDQRAHLDNIGQQDQTMIAIIGENHTYVAHQVHQILIMNELIKKEDVAVAFEMPHNFLVSKMCGEKAADHAKRLQSFDRETSGAFSLNFAVSANYTTEAPLSRFAFNRLLLKNNIKTCFCDVARSDEDGMDLQAPSSLDSIRFFFKNELPEVIEALDPIGMAARNHHMAKIVTNFAATYKPRIIFLQCGSSHVDGAGEKDFQNGDGVILTGEDCGLLSCFNRAALPAVGIVQSPLNSVPEDEAIFVCKGLPLVSAIYDQNTGKPDKKTIGHIRSVKGEASYLNALLSRVGLASEMASPNDWQAGRDQCKKDMLEYIQRALKDVSPKAAP